MCFDCKQAGRRAREKQAGREVFRYMQSDGTTRRELRAPEDVFTADRLVDEDT